MGTSRAEVLVPTPSSCSQRYTLSDNRDRKTALAELRAKFECKKGGAPRQSLLEEIRGRFEQGVGKPELDLDECVCG